MGLYFRNSIRVGPLRFNLSKSGIGVSTGIPGLRLGSGPRGNYVQIGAKGVYYRTMLAPVHRQPPPSSPLVQPLMPGPANPNIPSDSAGPFLEIESADISALVDSTSTELLEEIARKKQRIRLLIPAGIATLLIGWWCFMNLPGPWPMLVVGLLAVGCALVHLHDTMRKTVVLFYELDETIAHAYEGIHSAGKHLASAGRLWHVHAEAKVHDGRYHAGAAHLSDRRPTNVNWKPPSFVKTNVEVFNIRVGRQTLFLFPDRILVSEPGGIGAVGYRELKISRKDIRFIESETVPSDSEVVGKTWRYVNKNGSPDRRFKNNRELPICKYGELHLSSASGLSEMLMVSCPATATYVYDHLSYLASRLPEHALGRLAGT